MEQNERLISANYLDGKIKEAQKQLESAPEPMRSINRKYYKGLCWARRLVTDAPTVDAVKVVRCKDCLHRKERVCCNPSAGMWVGVELKDSDFCSYGERRTDV